MWTIARKSNLDIAALTEQIITAGEINRQEYLELTSTILSNDKITEEEYRQINRVFDYVQTGRLKLVD